MRIKVIVFLICLAGVASAMEATAGNKSFQLQAIKRQVSEQIIGLSAIIEALATKLKAAEDLAASNNDELQALKDSMAACSAQQKIYDPQNDTCVDVSGEPVEASNASCPSSGVSWGSTIRGPCTASLPAEPHGTSRGVSDVLPPPTCVDASEGSVGTATFTCDNGSWTYVSGSCQYSVQFASCGGN